jgi:hypothetical protein
LPEFKKQSRFWEPKSKHLYELEKGFSQNFLKYESFNTIAGLNPKELERLEKLLIQYE